MEAEASIQATDKPAVFSAGLVYENKNNK